MLSYADTAAHLPSTRSKFRFAQTMCENHVTGYGGYVSWSGGKDSTTVVRMASLINPLIPVVFFDSGIEFPENVDYMHRMAERWGLNFHTITAVPDALTILKNSGIWDDTAPLADTADLHETLIGVPSRAADQRFGAAHLWGLRAKESDARRRLLSPGRGQFTRSTGTRVCSPIWDWSDDTVWAYLAAHGVPENPVYDKLMSLGAAGKDLRVGMAFDGSNLQHGRVRWLRLGWPELYDSICDALPRVRHYR